MFSSILILFLSILDHTDISSKNLDANERDYALLKSNSRTHTHTHTWFYLYYDSKSKTNKHTLGNKLQSVIISYVIMSHFRF